MSERSSNWSLHDGNGVHHWRMSTPPGLLATFVTRHAGASAPPFASLNLSSAVGDDPVCVRANLDRVTAALDLPGLVTLRQTHSDIVVPVAYDRIPADAVEGDALFTGRPGIGIALRVADCLPVFIWSRDLRCIGLAHSGWRGTAARIAEKLARAMSRRFAVPTTGLDYAFGPCICPRCYEVGLDVAGHFGDGFEAPGRFLRPLGEGDRFQLDLRTANRVQLDALGLEERAGLDLCTREQPATCYSARRDGTTGRNLAVMALVPPVSR